MAKNHDGWEEIFSKLSIVECVNNAGHFDITADQIKAFSNREPRLMAKIDFREHLPPVMADNHLAILAIANGTYRIAKFDPFINIDPVCRVDPTPINFPDNIITINPKKLAHESLVLDAAHISGVLANVFGEDVRLTIRGRTRSPDFVLPFKQIPFPISGVQIEVDGGYEGATTVNLVEAKIGSRSNINLRQLIYPQLAWQKIINDRKIVRTFLCFYQEPILRFIPVVYTEGVYTIDHQHERAFLFEPEAKLDLQSIKENPNALAPILGVPFPQADNFETVLAMFSIVVEENGISKDDLFLKFDLVYRQIDYYSNVLRWLGVAEENDSLIVPTAEGKRISSLTHARKMKRLAEIIFSEPIFNWALNKPDRNVPHELFMRWKCTGNTIDRRLVTVRSWIKYFQAFSKQT
jgi:hypothetical protein